MKLLRLLLVLAAILAVSAAISAQAPGPDDSTLVIAQSVDTDG
ncbi:MAG: hypothetical protein OXE46_15260 [Chloroflexi bacterium]|nr:hypothetical protein [Chloroflexota bacterium]